MVEIDKYCYFYCFCIRKVLFVCLFVCLSYHLNFCGEFFFFENSAPRRSQDGSGICRCCFDCRR